MTTFTMDTEHSVTIPCSDATLNGILHIPVNASGIVLFAHGSGSSRLSPRNQHVAGILQNARLATLLFDLLTAEEEKADLHTMTFRFDIPFLAARLIEATEWIKVNPALNNLPIGYFGSSTGGGAALVAAAEEKPLVKAVVSRGGRPDLAEQALPKVRAATLLIVGGEDAPVIEMNQSAFERLDCEKKLEIIPGATHLFEEPGTLDEAAQLAAKWFKKYLC